MRRPIVIVPACVHQIGPHPYHAAQLKYVDAIVRGTGCVPLVLPALGEALDLETVLAACDGIMLSGAASNVDSSYYGQSLRNPLLPLDGARDATTLPLIRAALKRGIPMFALCRGFQELNVALGGSLHQAVQELPGMLDHREDPKAALEVQYGPVHRVTLVHGGMLADLLGVSAIDVNSLHGQGIDRLATGLVVEATADDGLVEAFSMPSAPGFALGVQWHPEWQVASNPDYMKLFGAFGQACRAYHAKRGRPA
ncbi:MAG: gamma-glutamyl-gamma-aminobutyrate hydrolase family protein [Pseudomonadota bacterium]